MPGSRLSDQVRVVSAEYRGNTDEGLQNTGLCFMRTWDVYVEEDFVNGACCTNLAPWMRVELPEGNGLDSRMLEKEIMNRWPFPVLTLDLLMQVGSPPPVWVCLRSRQGDVLPPGLVPAIRVRPTNLAALPKLVLIYEADSDKKVDLREKVPHRILALHRSQLPSSILQELHNTMPGYDFELFREGGEREWEELSFQTEQLLLAGVLRLKATLRMQTRGSEELLREGIASGEDRLRKRSLQGRRIYGDQPELYQGY
eukprot:TRINITY_DN1709_c0_g1_i2.p1 TRINITY_DN1709_c0_g1~~TRINITY_DN1709_c0_g1_i2.p1  ORF type:complete len:256 (+),score=18.10 TRINITY_DN1709_c0_g1_i2:429-1196(+)